MKQIKEAVLQPPPPPPPLPLPRFWVKKTVTESVTNREIAKFWRQKRIEEEDHLLAAIKAAARIRARNLSVSYFPDHWTHKSYLEENYQSYMQSKQPELEFMEENYKRFEESLKDGDEDAKEDINATAATNDSKEGEKNSEIRVGIKDWWTKSKYAYLNQPAIESLDAPKRRTSTYSPNCLSYKPTPLYPTSLGVF